MNTDRHTFFVDLIEGFLKVDDRRAESFSIQRDDSYREEHLAVKKGRFDKLCSFQEGLETVNLILAAEKSCRLRGWVHR